MASDCKVKDLEALKKEIRALLISSKHGCTPKQLQADYLQVMGESIPYHYMGFTNFMAFINSIPDVVSVCRSKSNVVLYGIADKKTQKIKDLVSKQKDKKKMAAGWSYGPPRMNMTSSTIKPAPKEPAVPSEFKVRLRELMLTHPNGIALKFFNEAFAKRFCHYIAFRNYGFDSLESLIRSVPDVLEIHKDATRNIEMVRRVFSLEASDSKEVCGTQREGGGVKQQQRSINWYCLNNENKEESKSPVTSTPPEKTPPLSLNALELSPQMKKKLLKAPEQAEPRKKNIPWTLAGKIKTLLQNNKMGVWVSRFLVVYQEQFKEKLDVRALGYSSVVHLLQAVPCCALEKPGTTGGDWLVYLKGTTPPKVGGNRAFQAAAYLSETLIRAVHATLKGREEGIPLQDFSAQFKAVTDYDLPREELGFCSCAELLQRVPGVEMKRPPNAPSIMVTRSEDHTPSKDEEEGDKKKKTDEEKNKSVSSPRKEPLPAKPSVYSLVDLPKASNSVFHSVYVSEVLSPSCLYVQLIGKQTTQVLECLQEDLTAFYKSKEGQEYKIQDAYPGQPCCASFNNDGYWYRAEVVRLVCDDVVQIRYVDYGNLAEVPVASIRTPKLNHLVLPAQAIQCRLCHLKPAGSAWSLRANRLLKQMTKDIPLVAVVTAVENRLMSIYLVDTSTKRDVMINDALVSQGLALFESDTQADRAGAETYGTEPPLLGGDGKSIPAVRQPKDKFSPPPNPPSSLVSQQVFQPHPPATMPMPPLSVPPGMGGAPLSQAALLQYYQQLMQFNPYAFMGPFGQPPGPSPFNQPHLPPSQLPHPPPGHTPHPGVVLGTPQFRPSPPINNSRQPWPPGHTPQLPRPPPGHTPRPGLLVGAPEFHPSAPRHDLRPPSHAPQLPRPPPVHSGKPHPQPGPAAPLLPYSGATDNPSQGFSTPHKMERTSTPYPNQTSSLQSESQAQKRKIQPIVQSSDHTPNHAPSVTPHQENGGVSSQEPLWDCSSETGAGIGTSAEGVVVNGMESAPSGNGTCVQNGDPGGAGDGVEWSTVPRTTADESFLENISTPSSSDGEPPEDPLRDLPQSQGSDQQELSQEPQLDTFEELTRRKESLIERLTKAGSGDMEVLLLQLTAVVKEINVLASSSGAEEAKRSGREEVKREASSSSAEGETKERKKSSVSHSQKVRCKGKVREVEDALPGSAQTERTPSFPLSEGMWSSVEPAGVTGTEAENAAQKTVASSKNVENRSGDVKGCGLTVGNEINEVQGKPDDYSDQRGVEMSEDWGSAEPQSTLPEDWGLAVPEGAMSGDSESAIPGGRGSAILEDSGSTQPEDWESSAMPEDRGSAQPEERRLSVPEYRALPEDSGTAVPEERRSALPEDSGSVVPEERESAVPEERESSVPEDRGSAQLKDRRSERALSWNDLYDELDTSEDSSRLSVSASVRSTDTRDHREGIADSERSTDTRDHVEGTADSERSTDVQGHREGTADAVDIESGAEEVRKDDEDEDSAEVGTNKSDVGSKGNDKTEEKVLQSLDVVVERPVLEDSPWPPVQGEDSHTDHSPATENSSSEQTAKPCGGEASSLRVEMDLLKMEVTQEGMAAKESAGLSKEKATDSLSELPSVAGDLLVLSAAEEAVEKERGTDILTSGDLEVWGEDDSKSAGGARDDEVWGEETTGEGREGCEDGQEDDERWGEETTGGGREGQEDDVMWGEEEDEGQCELVEERNRDKSDGEVWGEKEGNNQEDVEQGNQSKEDKKKEESTVQGNAEERYDSVVKGRGEGNWDDEGSLIVTTSGDSVWVNMEDEVEGGVVNQDSLDKTSSGEDSGIESRKVSEAEELAPRLGNSLSLPQPCLPSLSSNRPAASSPPSVETSPDKPYLSLSSVKVTSFLPRNLHLPSPPPVKPSPPSTKARLSVSAKPYVPSSPPSLSAPPGLPKPLHLQTPPLSHTAMPCPQQSLKPHLPVAEPTPSPNRTVSHRSTPPAPSISNKSTPPRFSSVPPTFTETNTNKSASATSSRSTPPRLSAPPTSTETQSNKSAPPTSRRNTPPCPSAPPTATGVYSNRNTPSPSLSVRGGACSAPRDFRSLPSPSPSHRFPCSSFPVPKSAQGVTTPKKKPIGIGRGLSYDRSARSRRASSNIQPGVSQMAMGHTQLPHPIK